MNDLEWKAKADKFVESLKDKADLIDVMEASNGYHFQTKKRGRFNYCVEDDSLVVDPDWGIYTWFSKAGGNGHQYETGDVFTWLERYKGMDFWQACLFLAERYGIDVPKGIKRDDPAHAKEVKSRGQMFELAARFFEAQLWANPAALEYARGRGWSDDVIKAHRLGYSGGSTDAVKELTGILQMNECNTADPAAVSLIGRRGDIANWIKEHGITDGSDGWIENNAIMGMAHFPRLIYPHVWRGRVTYFSGRNLRKDGAHLVGEDAPKEGRPKSHNLPKALAGERARYFNAEFSRGRELCFVVEGQADAITLGQWGFPAVALVGVGADQAIADTLKQAKVKTVYIALDDDKAGQEALLKVAGVFGPMARLFNWIKPASMQDVENNDEQD
jgi:hypothetical protein